MKLHTYVKDVQYYKNFCHYHAMEVKGHVTEWKMFVLNEKVCHELLPVGLTDSPQIW